MNQPPISQEEKSAELLSILAESRSLLNFHQEICLNYPLTAPIKKFLHENTSPAPSTKKIIQARKKNNTQSGPKILLDDVNAEIKNCKCCSLAQSRSGILPGQGNETNPALFIISDWLPGDEITARKILSGKAENLLNKMLSAIKLGENDVYLTTIIKCCPLADKIPGPEEIKACRPFIARQISALTPRVIYTLGQAAAQAMLNTREPLLRLRGRFHQFESIPLLPSFHPSFLLKNTEMKKAAWHDLQMIETRLQAQK